MNFSDIDWKIVILAFGLLFIGFGIGGFANTLVHESGHYVVASFFNASAIKEFCFQPLTLSCGGEHSGSAGAVIYKGFPNAWTPNFGDDPFKVIPIALAGIVAETVFLVLVLYLTKTLLDRAERNYRLICFLPIGMVVFSVLGWFSVFAGVLFLHNGQGISDFCAVGFGLNKLAGKSDAETCPSPYSLDSFVMFIFLGSALLGFVISRWFHVDFRATGKIQQDSRRPLRKSRE